ncbi:hypothetical protein CLV62_12440 [Dysgonomonas alginatilytica]|uniref:Uncharacterized protein n=1 Tax=Dysgonomonas alginatilytica TaxID=1605892 RepID=A0A2V3PM59_9BACT|nr:hypothetical protein CLV62_12440 [Dysgonomonas alginatilytica]
MQQTFEDENKYKSPDFIKSGDLLSYSVYT